MADMFIENDNYIQLDALQEAITGSFVNNAVVTLTVIEDVLGATVPGASFPIALSYVASSNGTYRALLPFSLSITEGNRYKAILDVTGSGFTAKFTKNITARVRGT